MDTCALVFMKNTYFPDKFISLWREFEKLISSGMVIIPREVFDEICAQDDKLSRWARENEKMIEDIDEDQLKLTAEIQNKFKNLIDLNKQITDADPFIIALAKIKKATIVTEEGFAGHGAKKLKIPNVCSHYKIRCIKTTDFINEQDWRFE
jgi:hypothetical protein